MKEPESLQEAAIFFSNPDNCLEYLKVRRWRDGIVRCPNCGSDRVQFIPTRRVWECKNKHEKRQFSIKVGTVMEDSAIGLDKWLMVFWMLANCKNGVSSYEIHRDVKVTQKSAWFMLHRIRYALQDETETKLGYTGGPVQVDETWVGGKLNNMHKSRQAKMRALRDAVERPDQYMGKTVVMGMLDTKERRVRATIIPNVKRKVLQEQILKHIFGGSKIHTDDATGYIGIPAEKYVHEVVNHLETYVNGKVHTNGIENFWSLLKRGLRGTYVAVEPFHLHRYVDEQVFRYNNRATKDNPLTDADRFDLAVSQIVNKRLTYAELTGKVGETQA
jgi:hypothetical protein